MKRILMVERDHITNYVSEIMIAHWGYTKVKGLFKFAELCTGEFDTYGNQIFIPTFEGHPCLEMAMNRMTMDRYSHGITVHELEDTARKNMLAMKDRTDRLAMLECVGWCYGKPPACPTNRPGHTAAVVQVIMPVRIMYMYEHARR